MPPTKHLQRPIANSLSLMTTSSTTARNPPPSIQHIHHQQRTLTKSTTPSRANSPQHLRHPKTHKRPFHLTHPHPAVARPRPQENLRTKDRGPKSKEDTQTDFNTLDVLGGQVIPSSSIDICTSDGFMLDSGLRIDEGNGIILTGSEALVWRPWMGLEAERTGTGGGGGKRWWREGEVVNGEEVRRHPDAATESHRTAGIVNEYGQFDLEASCLGVFSLLWPRPDLLIIGTGPSIRPLSPRTRTALLGLGMRLEVLDTRNAASTFNMMAVERGVQEIAAMMVPVGFGLKEVVRKGKPKKVEGV